MTDVGEIGHQIRPQTRPRVRGGDREIAELAARQHNVLARWQLLQLGLGPGAIKRRVAVGRLHPVHRGVYSVGTPRVVGLGRFMAAVLACGPGAVLSHHSAAELWGLLRSARSQVDVTTLRRCRARPGIALHRTRWLPKEDRTVREGIPVTSLARTLLDLAPVASPRELGRAFEEAERLRVLDVRAIEPRCARRRGGPALRALIEDAREPPDTRSELEQRFVELCRDEGLPPPALNATVAGYVVDALWPRERLVVELDGYAFHRGRRSFEDDRRRDADLQLAGYRVLRITARRLAREPKAVARSVRALLAA